MTTYLVSDRARWAPWMGRELENPAWDHRPQVGVSLRQMTLERRHLSVPGMEKAQEMTTRPVPWIPDIEP